MSQRVWYSWDHLSSLLSRGLPRVLCVQNMKYSLYRMNVFALCPGWQVFHEVFQGFLDYWSVVQLTSFPSCKYSLCILMLVPKSQDSFLLRERSSRRQVIGRSSTLFVSGSFSFWTSPLVQNRNYLHMGSFVFVFDNCICFCDGNWAIKIVLQ